MCSIQAYDRYQPTAENHKSSDGGRPLTFIKQNTLVSLRLTLNFIDNWIQ